MGQYPLAMRAARMCTTHSHWNALPCLAPRRAQEADLGSAIFVGASAEATVEWTAFESNKPDDARPLLFLLQLLARFRLV
jgi:hypothetical protein